MPLWCTVMPITSFLLIPAIQGTIPAYFMAFASLGLVMASGETGSFEVRRNRYLSIAFLCAGIWLLLFCGSQFGHLVSNRHGFGDLVLIRPDDTRVLFRRALFTQTTYLCACICIALFFRFFFREEWMRYVLWGAWFLALYGIYEWLFFLIFKRPGDFIANRMYGEHPGSWSQTMAVGPLSLLRIKSTFGEPSWFSASVIPVFLSCVQEQEPVALRGAALLHCLLNPRPRTLDSRSPLSSMLLGGGGLTQGFCSQHWHSWQRFSPCTMCIRTHLTRCSPQSSEAKMILARVEWSTLHPPMSRRLHSRSKPAFGIGFGYHYGGVFFAVLMNTGWIGLLVYLYVF